jgi:hypothetical protein
MPDEKDPRAIVLYGPSRPKTTYTSPGWFRPRGEAKAALTMMSLRPSLFTSPAGLIAKPALSPSASPVIAKLVTPDVTIPKSILIGDACPNTTYTTPSVAPPLMAVTM